jgi:hypothetical protein
MKNCGIFLLCMFVFSCAGKVEDSEPSLMEDSGADQTTIDSSTDQSVYIPCSVQFGGGATGYQNGCLIESAFDPTSSKWWVNMVADKATYNNASNVKLIDAVVLALQGAPRIGTFDFNSPDLLNSFFLLTLDDGTEHGVELAALKDQQDDGGVKVVGATTLVVTAVTPQANGTIRISGSLDANLVINDPKQTSPAVKVHVTF